MPNEYEYDQVVEKARLTCPACPTQWQGTLKDGREFYWRYRCGVASLAVGNSPAGRQDVIEHIGGQLDGYMSGGQFMDSFLRLFSRLEG